MEKMVAIGKQSSGLKASIARWAKGVGLENGMVWCRCRLFTSKPNKSRLVIHLNSYIVINLLKFFLSNQALCNNTIKVECNSQFTAYSRLQDSA